MIQELVKLQIEAQLGPLFGNNIQLEFSKDFPANEFKTKSSKQSCAFLLQQQNVCGNFLSQIYEKSTFKQHPHSFQDIDFMPII